jgi:hypothetical protein
VEVLLAACISSVILAAAWPWLWNAAAASRRAVDREQARTVAAFALRCVSADLGQATALLPLPAGVSPARALLVRHDHQKGGTETVLIRWEPATRVLWRKTSSTYLADRVSAFGVAYFDARGVQVDPAGSTWPAAVALVRLTLSVTVGAEVSTVQRSLPWPGP